MVWSAVFPKEQYFMTHIPIAKMAERNRQVSDGVLLTVVLHEYTLEYVVRCLYLLISPLSFRVSFMLQHQSAPTTTIPTPFLFWCSISQMNQTTIPTAFCFGLQFPK